MAYRKEYLVPTQYKWIDNLKMFLNHFYIKENRTSIRIHAVTRTMKEVYLQNRFAVIFSITQITYLIYLCELYQHFFLITYDTYNIVKH